MIPQALARVRQLCRGFSLISAIVYCGLRNKKTSHCISARATKGFSLTRPRGYFTGIQSDSAYSDSRVSLLSTPSHLVSRSSGVNADFVSGYSCGAVTESHRLPQNALLIIHVY